MVYGVGIVLVGVFHAGSQAAANGTIAIHFIGAFLSIVAGNITAIVVGRQWDYLRTPRWFGTVSVSAGVVGLVSGVVLVTMFNSSLAGVPERVSVYTIISWEMLTGVVFLAGTFQRPHAHSTLVS